MSHSTEFSSLNLSPVLLNNLKTLDFAQMTEIQAKSLPLILDGKDVLAKAKTGSGKTVAFALGLLSNLNVKRYRVQSLVLCPTRELAEQVAQEIRRIGRAIDNMKVLTLCGGTPVGPQIASLQHGAHIIVGTPGRVLDHLLKGRLNLREVNTLVLDEADRMLDMGFEEEMSSIFAHVPARRQILLFSATYPETIKSISAAIQVEPQQVVVEATHDTSKIEQIYVEVESAHKDKTVAALLTEYQPQSCIVFCNTKIACQNVQISLSELGFSVLALQGDMEQKERNQVLTRFANKSCSVLVATDVAARGLDVKDVGAVISYDITPDPEVHVHRIGRTGRADAKGLAITLCAAKEVGRANAIEDYLKIKLNWKAFQSLRFHANRIVAPEYQTLAIDGGKKAKLRPGDILGALTQEAGIPGDDIGKITISAMHSYVAIKVRSVKRALAMFREGKIKGRKFKARKLTS